MRYLVAAALLLSLGTASGAERHTISSATWLFSGHCTGEDMWNSWKVSGAGAQGDAFVRPWMDVPIFVVGYELVKLRPPLSLILLLHPQSLLHPLLLLNNPSQSWFTVGSTITPDWMVALGPGETHAKQLWPVGYGQPWPAAKDARPVVPLKDKVGKTYAAGGDLLDIHGACFDAGPIKILLTVYYTVP